MELENLPFAVSTVQKSNLPDAKKTDKIDSWNPMDEDFSCATFNSYKYFNVLKAELPGKKSPEKRLQQSPEKPAEDISLYIGNIPSTITNEGIKNLFLAVGKVQSCKILPPKDSCNDTKYGFVKFYTWKDALKAIGEYDGLCLGSEEKLRVRVAHRRRDDDYFSRDEEYSSSDGTAKDNPNNGQSPFDECHKVGGKNVCDQSLGRLKGEANYKNSDQNSCIPQQLSNVIKSESIMNEELFPEANNGSAATPRIMMPCTCCDKLCKQRCSACKAPYCSRECQKIDRVRHKLVCTYQNNSKPAKSEVKVPVATNGPMSAPDDLDNDSDFDCIDISLESSTSRKAKPNTEQRNDGDVSLDSSFCQDSGVVISRESPCEELNSDPRVATHTADINVIMASNVPNDVLPSTISFDIVVCYFLTPNSFWIWFMNTAKELFIRLLPCLMKLTRSPRIQNICQSPAN
ncbi:uncharacterized protein LOC114534182 [Dendronephthya gigantea]|uniref:uncharacterized protein LOC114534182 n=1 Tax=Dendronephthya gigantea TaxID=151771 RepID=UPI00106995D6|nr:uncharacterized protein LOC114534182 [Dendronephthya gigantea]